jgi:hypothetical protein
VRIERERRRPAKRLHRRDPKRKVRHEVAIHDVEVDPVDPGLLCCLN